MINPNQAARVIDYNPSHVLGPDTERVNQDGQIQDEIWTDISVNN